MSLKKLTPEYVKIFRFMVWASLFHQKESQPMSAGSKLGVSGLLALIGILLWTQLVSGYQINDKFSISGVLAGAWQYQDIDQAPGTD